MQSDRLNPLKAVKLRVRITESLSGSIDGIQLDRFRTGFVYDVGTSLGCYLLSVGSAEPVLDQSPALILPIEQQLFAAEAEAPAKAKPFGQANDAERRPRKKPDKSRP